jgi:branched-subunit amino acid transport protein
VTTLWICVAATAATSFAIKAAGPALLGQRPLPDNVRVVLALLAPVLLFALVVTQLLGPDWSAFDTTALAGVAAAAVARLLGLHSLAAVACGVVVTALLRAL